MRYPIAKAEKRDAEALAEVQSRALPPGWGKDTFELYAASGSHVLLKAADRQGAIVGVIVLRAVAEEAEILTLAVSLEVRRQAIATGLFETALDAAIARGAGRVFLEVAASNIAARALYGKLGFETIASRRNYYTGSAAGSSTALIMALTLRRRGG